MVSAARNESIKHATCDWILWVDADESFDSENLEKLKRLLAELRSDNIAYFMKQASLHGSAGAETVVEQVRLFRNRLDHRWTYRVHEQIQPALEAGGAEFRSTQIVIRHRGYVDDRVTVGKLERNLLLAQMDLSEHPDDAFVLFNLGSIYCGLNRPVEALPLLRCSLELTGPDFTISQQTYALVSRCHQKFGQPDEAIRLCLEGRNAFPRDVELMHMECDLRLARNDLSGAERCLAGYTGGNALRSEDSASQLNSIDPVTGGNALRSEDFASRLNSAGRATGGHALRSEDSASRLTASSLALQVREKLAFVYVAQHRFADAEALCKEALIEDPKCLPALAGLGGIYLQTQRWADVATNAHAMSRLGPLGAEEAAVQVGVMRMWQNLFEAAYIHLLTAARRFPESRRINELLAKLKQVRQSARDQTAPAATADYPLTSIIILTHNQLELTKLCVGSIRRFTAEPIELIFVDNASTDGTPDFLATVPGATIIRNSVNRGFGAGANQGLQVAKGEQLLLLNNDTIVTAGWLRRLLDALRSDCKVGLVGPCSNRVGGEQQIEVSYDNLGDLDAFAEKWGQQNQNQRLDTGRLVGFCLLISREVIDRIGMLDEQFGIGMFEDDDYCLRAAQAGFRAVIARDSFVHHFGGQTFLGLGVDYEALLKTNQKQFEKKWPNSDSSRVMARFE